MKRQIQLMLLFVSVMGCHHQGEEHHQALFTRAPNKTRAIPVNIVASIEKSTFVPGDNIAVHIVLEFNGSVIYLESNDFFHNYLPEVVSPAGKVKELSPLGARYFGDMAGGRIQRRLIHGPFVDTYDFPLTDLYDFSEPGVYQVRFEHTVVSAPQSPDSTDIRLPEPEFVGIIFSNAVSIHVK